MKNNRTLLIYIFLFFLYCTHFTLLHAQIGEHRNEFAIGISGGLTFSSIDFDPTIKQAKHSGFISGLTARYTCEKYFKTLCALQVEINYAQLGWKEDIKNYNGDNLPDKYQRTLEYIQIPMFAHLAWGKEKRGLMFFINIGPQIGFCINESDKKSDIWTLNTEGNPDRPNNLYQQYDLKLDHKFDYGITGGLGLEYNSALGHFFIEGRYYFGLSDIFNNSKKDVFSRSANQNIEVRLGYLISTKFFKRHNKE